MGGAHHEYIMPMLYILERIMTSTIYMLANVFVIVTFLELFGSVSYIHSFTHPIHGLIKRNILRFAYDMVHSIRLTFVVQNVFNYGVAWFPKIHQSHENVFFILASFVGAYRF
jgi:hypothetical protein